MDFCIADTEEILNKTDDINKNDFFLTNLITFIDFDTFFKAYLTSFEYNDPTIRRFNLFSLKIGDQFLDDETSKLR